MSSPRPIPAEEVPAPSKKSNYPEPYASLVNGRVKRKLGDFFDLKIFGGNLATLAPGSMSTLKHQHSQQDEFVYNIGRHSNPGLRKPRICSETWRMRWVSGW